MPSSFGSLGLCRAKMLHHEMAWNAVDSSMQQLLHHPTIRSDPREFIYLVMPMYSSGLRVWPIGTSLPVGEIMSILVT